MPATPQPRELPFTTHRYGPGAAHLVERYEPPPGVQRVRGRVVVIHGGFWRERYDRTHARAQVRAYAASGIESHLIEYCRTGMEHGGWPGTFEDVLDAAEKALGDGGGPVVLVGHSAGGHLAAWLAAHPAHSTEHDVHSKETGPRSPWAGAILVGAVPDLTTADQLALGHHAARDLLGGSPDDHPDRWAYADPMHRPVPTCPIRLVHGADDEEVPVRATDRYLDRLVAAGADVTREVLPATGHYEVLDPTTALWRRTRDLAAGLLANAP